VWFVLCLLLLVLGVLAWLAYTGRVSVSEWTQKLDSLLGVSPTERHEPDYFAEEPVGERPAAQAWNPPPPAETEPAAARAEAPVRRDTEEPVLAPSAAPERETIVLPKRQPAPPQAAPALPTLELSREYRKRVRQAPPEPQAKDLPVIGLNELQSNLQSDYRRRQAGRALSQSVKDEGSTLPLIDPSEVREQLRHIHSKRGKTMAAPSAPMSRPQVLKPQEPVAEPQIVPPPVVRHELPASARPAQHGWLAPARPPMPPLEPEIVAFPQVSDAFDTPPAEPEIVAVAAAPSAPALMSARSEVAADAPEAMPPEPEVLAVADAFEAPAPTPAEPEAAAPQAEALIAAPLARPAEPPVAVTMAMPPSPQPESGPPALPAGFCRHWRASGPPARG